MIVADDHRDVPPRFQLGGEGFEENPQLPMEIGLVFDAEQKANTRPAL